MSKASARVARGVESEATRRLTNPQHTCHARGCNVKTKPKMFMCLKHWRMIPQHMQDELWAVYVPGQEIRKDPSREYIEVAMRLVRYVQEKEAS